MAERRQEGGGGEGRREGLRVSEEGKLKFEKGRKESRKEELRTERREGGRGGEEN